jgi:hypothetical protein
MKAQGLPMSTIILFILVLLVLVGVGIFFFTQFAVGEKGASGANCLQLCQSVNAIYASNATYYGADLSLLKATAPGASYCSSCNKIYDCQIADKGLLDNSC